MPKASASSPSILVLFALVIAHMGAPTAYAQQGTLANDCAVDIKTYCANVLPGGDRVVACLIAYEDKISPRCRLTAYMGSANLGVRMKELQAMSKICSSDILQYCTKVPAGGGRIYDCLMSHKATLTDDCRGSIPRFQTILKD